MTPVKAWCAGNSLRLRTEAEQYSGNYVRFNQIGARMASQDCLAVEIIPDTYANESEQYRALPVSNDSMLVAFKLSFPDDELDAVIVINGTDIDSAYAIKQFLLGRDGTVLLRLVTKIDHRTIIVEKIE